MKHETKSHVLLYKILFSAMIMVIYIIGRNIPLLGVDVSFYKNVNVDAQSIFEQMLTGDMKNISIFILGLWPHIIATFFVMIYMAIRSIDKNAALSANHMNIATNVILMIIASFQAYQKVKDLVFLEEYNNIFWKIIVFLELIAGMMLVIYLCDRTTKYGIGGRLSIFLVNIYDGVFVMIAGKDWDELKLPLLIGIVEGILMIIFENTEKRIPVQRVSIHSIYSDKNYLAYKINPTGITPLMFASAFFFLVQLIVGFLLRFYPYSERVVWTYFNMNMSLPLGMITYIASVWVSNFLFAFLTLTPIKTADNLLKSGDSLENVYAGRRTKLYLFGCVLRLTIYSSVLFSVFLGIPFYLQYLGYIDSSIVMLPSMIMMSVGLWIALYREAEVYYHYDSYKAFI